MDCKELNEFALTVLIEYKRSELFLKVLFNPSEFEVSTIRRILEHFKNFISAYIDLSSINVKDLCKRILNQSQLTFLTKYSPTLNNPYARPTSVKDVFEYAVDSWPKMIALDSIAGITTFCELANCIGNQLSSKIRLGDIIAIVSDASFFWIVSILSVIKTGATYYPIDVKLPE